MKTLHITNAWHGRSGGIRTFYKALLEEANRSGHTMRLVVPAESSEVETVGQYGRIYHVAAPAAPFSPSYRVIYPHRALLPGGEVHRILVEEEPDLVEFCDKYTMNYAAGLLRTGRLPGIRFRPAVIGLSCERFEQSVRNYVLNARITDWFAELYLRWLYFPMADHHIAVSGYVAAELRGVSAGHKVDRGVWIGEMGVDAAVFARARRDERLRAELGAGASMRLLVYAGRLMREKNIRLLFETMAVLGDGYRLLMVGAGDGRAEMERDAATLAPGRVDFVGFRREPSELARLLVCCDAFVHPNPSEPYGIGPLEAMAAGLPLIAPNQGGVTAYANDGNAWLCAPTAEGFAAGVRAVFSDAQERESRVAAARAAAWERSWTAAAGHYLRLYRELHARVRQQGAYSLEPAFFSTRGYAG
ncbi:MAG: glycosyltransferase [Bryobacteraceae bacterium]